MLGFSFTTHTSVGNQIISDYAVNLIGNDFLCIKMSNIDDLNIKTNVNNFNVNFLIPITVNSGQQIYFYNNTAYDIVNDVIYETTFKTMSVKLMNYDGSLWENNNADFVCMFQYE